MRANRIRYSLTLLSLGACLAWPAPFSVAETKAPDAVAITAVAEKFHSALAAGKPDEVMSLLQPDALIVEGGAVQTRGEYESEHLGEDIAYARAVPARQLRVVVRQEGAIAWVTSTFRVTGKFQSKTVDNLAAETMILTKSGASWGIRAIHWSSHKAPKI